MPQHLLPGTGFLEILALCSSRSRLFASLRPRYAGLRP
jgi:hypothetical protein